VRLRVGLVAGGIGLILLAGCGATPAVAPRAPTHRPVSYGTSPTTTRVIRVVGLGDSVMAGTHCGCAGLAEEYAKALQARTGGRIQVTNLGANGLVTADVLADLDRDASTRNAISRADLVVVTIGANDLVPQLDEWETTGCDRTCFSGPAVRMGRNLKRVLAAIRALRISHPEPVLVTDYWNVFTDGDVARRAGGQAQIDWNAAVTAVANQQICAAVLSAGDTCVDLVNPFKGGGADPTPLLAADGDHPNAAGVQAIVDALLAATPAVL
jgi:lysophospholipase L1-like esterase